MARARLSVDLGLAKMASKGDMSDKKKLDKYVPTSEFDSGVELEKTLAAANGRKPVSDAQVRHEQQLSFFGLDQEPMRARLKEAGELADQYKREQRGNNNRAPRGRIKMNVPEGYAKGGKVRGCGKAVKGLTKGRMR